MITQTRIKIKISHCHLVADRVLAPVFTSVEHMSVPIQKAAARIAVKAFCDAWLDHITSSKVKFR